MKAVTLRLQAFDERDNALLPELGEKSLCLRVGRKFSRSRLRFADTDIEVAVRRIPRRRARA